MSRRVKLLDLHGYDVLTAVDLTLTTVREAFENGYAEVDVRHGARDVVDPVEPGEGRGGIKWELRRMIRGGHFDTWTDTVDVMEGGVRFLIRNNPRQRREHWSPLPRRTRG